MLRPFDTANTKRTIDHSENPENLETTSKESPSDNKNILTNKQDLFLKKKNSNNNTNKSFNKPVTPLKRSGSANSLAYESPTNKRLDSKYHEIETGYQHEEELEYIPEEALSIDINDFEDNIHMEAYERDLDIKQPDLILFENESTLTKSKRQFQTDISTKNTLLQDEDVHKKPILKQDLEKAIEKSIVMPDISRPILIEYPEEIEYCPPPEEESEYIPDEVLSIDLNSFDDNLIFEAYEGTSDSDNSEYLYEIESSFIKPKRQFQVDKDYKEEDEEFLRDEDVYKKPTSKHDLIKAIEESIIMPDITEIAPIEFPIEIEDSPSYEEVYQFII
ncbi:unnamed protein product [Cunninghamella echinulata]